MKVALPAIVAVAVAFSAVTVNAATKEEEAIKYRKAVMTTMAWNVGPIGAMVKGDRPFDKDLAIRNAERLEALAKMPLEGFAPGTEQGDTKVKAEAFLEMDKFRAGMEKLQSETAKLAQAAKSGNLDQIKPQFGEVGKVCKGCHDTYRNK